ncbi:MAG: arginine--tRNA ligase [bacterium]|nr:arginine--tRNA ligase [bacterium]
MVIDYLESRVAQALQLLQEEGIVSADIRADVIIEVPREKSHGDYACNIALQAAKGSSMPPRMLAEAIRQRLDLDPDIISSTEVAGPGFINFFMSRKVPADNLKRILTENGDYGRSEPVPGERVLVEFVSANPTGPLHVGHGRGAAVGDTLARLLKAAGRDVGKEFYINDAGTQMEMLGRSIDVRYREILGEAVAMPADGYHGEYITGIAGDIFEREGDVPRKLPEEERIAFFRKIGEKRLLAEQQETLANFGVTFDTWFGECELYESGQVEAAIETLKERGYVYANADALWFKATAFGDDKDRVLIRQNEVPTYLAADIAYHKNKLDRGFTRLVDIWGADHHGYIPRMRASIQALGYPPEALEVLIIQMVRLMRGGEQVMMSKRAGEFVSLDDILAEVGRDAARFFFIMRSTDSQLDFDLALAVEQSNENPVYYVQYAHARICSLLFQDEARNLQPDNADLSLLQEPSEIELMKKLLDYPREIQEAAGSFEVHRLPRFSQDLAALFHQFYNNCRILGEDKALSSARLALCKATRQVLANLLEMMGISAPERM